MIVETTSNQIYRVEPADGIDHAWQGVEVKRAKGEYVPKAKARVVLVRKSRVQGHRAGRTAVSETRY